MTSRKAKGDAGEAAYAARCESEGGVAIPLSPSLDSCDLLILWPNGTLELSEVKAWQRSLSPQTIADTTRALLTRRENLPDKWRRRTKLSLIHAVKGEDGAYRFAETWRFP